VLIACGIHPWADRGALYSLLCFSFSAFVITAICTEVFRGAISLKQQSGKSLFSSMRQLFTANTRRHGAFIVHFGIVLMFIGFAGSAFNRSVEQELHTNESMDIGPYHLVSRGFTPESTDNYVAERALIDVYRGGKQQFQLAPEARLYQATQTNQLMVANHSTPAWDLYVIYEGQDQDSGLPIIKAILNPLVIWIWIGACIVLLGALVALLPDRNKSVAVQQSSPISAED
jgi:cytochrome c-type biogenesis protein CcmF